MNQITVSNLRQNLPTFINKVFSGEEFLITKNGLSVAKLTPARMVKKKIKKKKILKEAFGMWRDLKGSTIEITERWRKEAWKGIYDN